jgi:hypothetical protein
MAKAHFSPDTDAFYVMLEPLNTISSKFKNLWAFADRRDDLSQGRSSQKRER